MSNRWATRNVLLCTTFVLRLFFLTHYIWFRLHAATQYRYSTVLSSATDFTLNFNFPFWQLFSCIDYLLHAYTNTLHMLIRSNGMFYCAQCVCVVVEKRQPNGWFTWQLLALGQPFNWNMLSVYNRYKCFTHQYSILTFKLWPLRLELKHNRYLHLLSFITTEVNVIDC